MLDWISTGNGTYIVSVVGLIVGVLEMVGVDVVPGVDKANAMQTIQVSLSAIFIRAGLKKAA